MFANLCVHTLAALPGTGVLAALSGAGALLAVVLRAVWPVGFAASLLWSSLGAQNVLDAQLPAQYEGSDVRVSGWVDSIPESLESRTRLTLRVTQGQPAALVGSRIRLNWYDAEFVPRPAQRLTLTVRLRRPHGFINPAGYDYERWLLLERISATGYVRAFHGHAGLQSGFLPRLLTSRAALRGHIIENVIQPRAAALIAALAIGDRSGFSDAHWTTFRRTGTSHLVAISGLHIGIVALGVLWLVVRAVKLTGSRRAEYVDCVAGIAAFFAALAYAALAGFSVSTVRAVVMLATGLLIVNLRREVSRIHGFALAALVIVILDPLATLGNSFWLSFGAVGTLLAVTSARALVPSGCRWCAAALAVVSVQCSLVLMSIPASALFFGEFSIAALPVNLLAIPVFSVLLVPLVLIGVLAELTLGAAGSLWYACGWLASAVMAGLETVAQFPAASFMVAPPTLYTALLAIAGVGLSLSWHPCRGKAVGALALLPLLYPSEDRLPEAAFRLTVLDVGHGLATIIETRNHRIVYDAGARFASGLDIGRDVVLPALRGKGDPGLLIVSHADNDHSGGAAAITAAFPGVSVLAGPDVDLQTARVCTAGQRWRLDEVDFEILHPPERFNGSGNDGSCVLRVSAPGGSALLSGDIERIGEAAVIAGGGADVDVLVAPHHGSATSSSPAFVAATSPGVVVFSAGFGNRWNFPVRDVVARWCAAGAAVYVTGEHGAVEIEVGTDVQGAIARRDARRRYWNARAASRCGESPTVTL